MPHCAPLFTRPRKCNLSGFWRLSSHRNRKNRANLVVTDGDLFEEKTKIKMVFVDGRRFEAHEPEKPKDPPKGNLTGKWKLTYTTPEGPEESTVDLDMATDGTLSGTTSSKRGTTSIINGYLSADKFSYTINIPVQGNPTDVVFTGTFDGTTLKGNIDVMGYSIELTGAKAGPLAAATSDSAVHYRTSNDSIAAGGAL